MVYILFVLFYLSTLYYLECASTQILDRIQICSTYVTVAACNIHTSLNEKSNLSTRLPRPQNENVMPKQQDGVCHHQGGPPKHIRPPTVHTYVVEEAF